jgi:hypothetical protein
MDDSNGGKIHELIRGGQVESLICTTEGCHQGVVKSDGKHLILEWDSKDGESLREVLRADPAESSPG